jgi:hypothetical protein
MASWSGLPPPPLLARCLREWWYVTNYGNEGGVWDWVDPVGSSQRTYDMEVELQASHLFIQDIRLGNVLPGHPRFIPETEALRDLLGRLHAFAADKRFWIPCEADPTLDFPPALPPFPPAAAAAPQAAAPASPVAVLNPLFERPPLCKPLESSSSPLFVSSSTPPSSPSCSSPLKLGAFFHGTCVVAADENELCLVGRPFLSSSSSRPPQPTLGLPSVPPPPPPPPDPPAPDPPRSLLPPCAPPPWNSSWDVVTVDGGIGGGAWSSSSCSAPPCGLRPYPTSPSSPSSSCSSTSFHQSFADRFDVDVRKLVSGVGISGVSLESYFEGHRDGGLALLVGRPRPAWAAPAA